MISAFVRFLRSPGVIVSFITAVIFQLLFSAIWLTGYDKITDRIDRFRIAVVNEDHEAGAQMAAAFKQNLKFQVQISEDIKSAMKLLDERKIQMVVHIPEHFTELMQDPSHPAAVQYSINESNPTMVKSVMENVANAMTRSLNSQAVQSGTDAVLKNMHMPAEQADQTAAGLSQRIIGEFHNIHPLSNFSHIMVPMMLVMASFTGAMLFAMEVNKTAKSMQGRFSRWNLIWARYILNVVAALVVSTIGSIMVYSMGVHPIQGFASMWLFQILYVCSFLFVAQLPFFLLGDAGAWVNIALLSVQLLSSGATIPREVLPSLYKAVSEYLPATYAVNGIMNMVTGGLRSGSEVLHLLILLLAAGGIGVVLAGFQKGKLPNNLAVTDPAGG